ncbi:MAG: malonyl-CoA synthase [Polaromonas sp.]|jgi:malonyl-CoA/methylmalonyl-CoA synthetase|nr:malonyl-CoA synthase [Polaromonas sp.]MBP6141672.1 malonyl-CoA synthase [Polaromonas sp.]MBP6155863.1 malonyl-CoA synthase [Polaromonas sp.]MBP7116099.1 malonyl-CoA synthase [Polaromonas sp.]MBP7307715.1 malonyl-CoA synthase [Polaromonas sp.]
MNHNLFTALRAAFPKDLDAVAIETADVGKNALYYSWRDMDRATAMLANLLQSLDLPKGARIVVQVEKSVEAAMLYLATLRAGFVFLPLNTAYQSGEIEYFIGNAEPSVVVCSPANFGWVSKIAFKAGTQNVFTLGDDRTGSLLDRAAHCSDQHTPANCKADDLAAILYTSGTTGRSKGAMLTHQNLLSNAQVLKDYWGWQKPGASLAQGGDVLIHALPIFHVHGLFVALHGALLNGSKTIWLSKFDPKLVIQKMPEATVFMGVPTLYVRMLAEPSLTKQATSRMRLFLAGSAPLLLETFNSWQERTGHTILERYGMSETTMLTSNPYLPKDGERRGGTVGFPLPGVQLRVQDDGGQNLPTNEIGGIQVKGPNIFKGYWRMPEKTAEEFTADGFFKTGDVGKIDDRGYVTIVGRSKDLIISGGYNVYPAEIESTINDMPGVSESAVIGVPHPDFGEVGVAVLILKPNATLTPDDVIANLKATLANFKIPKRCFALSELPRNTMGKVQKNVLREQYKGLFI